jgi:hypothetical protein
VQNAAVQLFEPETNLILHKDLRFHPELTFGEKLFLAEIQSIISKQEKQKLYYTLRDLSNQFSVSHQTVKLWIRKLTTMELLEVGVDYCCEKSRRHYLKNPKKN